MDKSNETKDANKNVHHAINLRLESVHNAVDVKSIEYDVDIG